MRECGKAWFVPIHTQWRILKNTRAYRFTNRFNITSETKFICNNVCCISNVSLTLNQYWNLLRSLAQLVSTSNKRSSSGEMKKRPEEGDIYREINIFWHLSISVKNINFPIYITLFRSFLHLFFFILRFIGHSCVSIYN